MTHYENIVANIPHGRQVASTWKHAHGGIVLSPNEGRLLEQLFSRLGGIHVDIGTYFGGSAILAAMSKPGGMVYTIDPQVSIHWGMGLITPQMVRENFAHFGVEKRITQIVAKSHPWPLNGLVESVFIDGDENEAIHDWENARDNVTDYVIFHDCRRIYPEVIKAVRSARYDRRFELVASVDSVRIFHRDLSA